MTFTLCITFVILVFLRSNNYAIKMINWRLHIYKNRKAFRENWTTSFWFMFFLTIRKQKLSCLLCFNALFLYYQNSTWHKYKRQMNSNGKRSRDKNRYLCYIFKSIKRDWKKKKKERKNPPKPKWQTNEAPEKWHGLNKINVDIHNN